VSDVRQTDAQFTEFVQVAGRQRTWRDESLLTMPLKLIRVAGAKRGLLEGCALSRGRRSQRLRCHRVEWRSAVDLTWSAAQADVRNRIARGIFPVGVHVDVSSGGDARRFGLAWSGDANRVHRREARAA